MLIVQIIKNNIQNMILEKNNINCTLICLTNLKK